MIQDKIFFDEKDPTGLSYNTPFTVYGSYQGRLWSKSPSGSIKYYTQNSDLSAYATTGSNQFSGSQTITGSLTVTGTITGTVAGTTATASYVEYTNVANKPALVSGSAQVTYSGLTGVPSGIVSGSAQITSFGIFATTGSNGFNGSQSITGSLTVTGQVVAQTLNVQQVTSSIVYSSGSNIFGNDLSNTQQFTGSLSVNGQGTFYQPLTNSTAYLTVQNNRARNAAVYTQTTNGGFYAGTSIGTDTFNYQIYDGVAGSARLTISSTGAATFNTTATTSVSAISTGTASGLQLTNSGGTASSWIIQSDGGAVAGQAALRFYSLTASAYRMSIDGSGNVGVGTTSPQSIFHIGAPAPANAGVKPYTGLSSTHEGFLFDYYYNTSASNVRIFDIAALGFAVNGAGGSELRFLTVPQTTTNTPLERMRITAAGNVGIGTISPSSRLNVAGAKTNSADLTTVSNQLAVTDTTATAAGVGGRISFLGAYTSTPDYFSFGTIEVLKDNANNYGSASWNNAAMRFIVGNNDNDANAGRMLERMRITSAGNVGIGTASPSAILDVRKPTASGDTQFNFVNSQNSSSGNTSITSTIYLGFFDDSNGLAAVNKIVSGKSGDYTSAPTANSFLAFHTTAANSTTEKMRITSGGAFKAKGTESTYHGISTSYHELRTGAGNQWAAVVSNTAGLPYGLNIDYNSSPNSSIHEFFYCTDAIQNTLRASIRSNGGIANYQANNVNLSDERTKKDIISLESYWDKFKALEIVKFKYKDQTHDDFNIGVIAQQVEQVAPEFVDVDGWDTKPKLDEEGNEIVSTEEPLKSIYTADLYHATIKVLQEAMSKIETLEAKIQTLEQQ
jgi:hypothetical protein